YRIVAKCAAISGGSRLRNFNCKQRDRMVIGTFCTSVVAKTNIACNGGSSSVFSMALNADLESMCTSSIIYTLYLPRVGEYPALSISSRMLSTPVFDAASISITSTKQLLSISRQFSQAPHGSFTCKFVQFNALAIILAIVVLPTPRVPVSKYA